MESIAIKEYFKVVRKRWWLIALCVLVFSLTAAVWSYYIVKPVYQASTKLIVNKSQQVENTLSQPTLNEINANIAIINTYKEVIRTRAIMDKVVQQYPELNMSADQLMGRIQVSSVNDTQVMTLSIMDYSYERAMHIVNAVSKVFQESLPSIMKVDNVTLLNEAMPTPNPHPVNYNPVMNIFVSCLVAFFLSLSLVFFLEYMDDSVKSESDIQRYLGGPALGVIHTVNEKTIRERKTNYPVKPDVGEAPYATASQ